MKKILVLAALSLAAISCTKSDVLDSPVLDKAINFNTYLGKAPVTKASVQDITSMANTGFNVKAFEVKTTITPAATEGTAASTAINGVDLTKTYMDVKLTGTKSTESTDENPVYTWAYTDESGKSAYYWPTNNETQLVFASYGLNAVPTDDTDKYIQFNEGSQTVFTYKVPETISEQQDLLVKTTNNIYNKETGENGVALKYEHMLSRIDFTIQSNVAAGLDIHFNNLHLTGNFYNSATVNLVPFDETNKTIDDATLSVITTGDNAITNEYKVIAGGENAAPITFNAKTTATSVYETTDAKDRYLMIIPQGVGEGTKIVGSYTIADDPTVRNIEIYLSDIQALQENGFEQGKAYKFALNISTSVIGFTVDITAWDETGNTFNPEI